MLRNVMMSLAAGLLAFGLVSTSFAGKFNEVLSIGDKAPAFSNLKGTDDKTYSLAEMKDAKVIVVCVTCNRCPVAVQYEDKFIKFASDYKSKGVVFLAVDANGDEMAAMKQRAEEKGFTFPYVVDADQTVARSYGATVTPHMFVIGQDRTVAYMGAFDADGKPTLSNAVDALLAGKKPEVTETKQFGCGVPYKKVKKAN